MSNNKKTEGTKSDVDRLRELRELVLTVRRCAGSGPALEALLADVEEASRSLDTSDARCPMVCPHGDRCALGAADPHPRGGHNMRACGCNEPLRRLDPREKLLALIDRATKLAADVLRQVESDNARLRALVDRGTRVALSSSLRHDRKLGDPVADKYREEITAVRDSAGLPRKIQ